MSDTSSEPFKTTIAPWLTVSDAQKAVEFYTAAFDAVERGIRLANRPSHRPVRL
jgi:uncharacterized glyoxalase superfamily protein PhnB